MKYIYIYIGGHSITNHIILGEEGQESPMLFQLQTFDFD